MKLADELRRECRRNPISLYYTMLISDIWKEAREGGTHKVITLNTVNYNTICKKLLNDGFTVFIYNYNIENSSHMTYVIWDKERFDESFKDNKDAKDKPMHYGLI